MPEPFYKKENCAGCLACLAVCGQGAIEMRTDDEGFIYPHIIYDKCVNCGKCKAACAFFRAQSAREYIDEPINTDRNVLVGRNKDIGVVEKSRSGGIFTAISDYFLEREGVVCGCVLNKELEAYHIITDATPIRDKMRGSKYVQSTVLPKVYFEIENSLKMDKYVLFTGTSCQIDGIKSFLGKEYERLLTTDILCHGAVSPLAWKEYIKYKESKNDAKCHDADFRNKKYGWAAHIETLYMTKSDGEEIEHSSKIYTDIFYEHYALRPSCYVCPYKTQEHPADITLGDCWGIDKIAPGYDDKGCSIVLINTKKGQEFFEKIMDKLDIENKKMSADLFQPAFHCSFSVDKEKRKEFWEKFYANTDAVFIEKEATDIGEYELMKKTANAVDSRSNSEVAFHILDGLCGIYESKRSIADFFIDNEIKTVAIYGWGKVGRHLYSALSGTAVELLYLIDKYAKTDENTELPLYRPQKGMPAVDAVLVSTAKYFYEIESELHPLMPNTHIISAETVIDYVGVI